MGVQFGIFDHLDQRREPAGKTFADRIEFIKAAEAGGYRTYHLAEHHGTPLGMASSPSVFLAAVAQATSTIRLGSLVYLLPLYDPLRLIEEICMLDHLSGGRLEVGIGRGISPIELGFFGVDAEVSAEITTEAFDVLRKGLSNEKLTHHGKHFHYDDVPMTVQSVQRPVPFWTASMSPEGLAAAAQAGMHSAMLGSPEMIREAVEVYRGARPASGTEVLQGMYRIVLVAPTDDTAERLARPAFKDWFDKLEQLWREHGIEAPLIGALREYETACEVGALVVGSPERVVDELSAQIEATDVNYVLTEIAFGDMTHADEMASLDLFIDRVMPNLTG